jgi:NADH/NAD ratio-sensing transcriptional regulator Rex
VVLTVPDEVLVRKVDLATELQILSFYQQRSSRRSPRRSSAGAA